MISLCSGWLNLRLNDDFIWNPFPDQSPGRLGIDGIGISKARFGPKRPVSMKAYGRYWDYRQDLCSQQIAGKEDSTWLGSYKARVVRNPDGPDGFWFHNIPNHVNPCRLQGGFIQMYYCPVFRRCLRLDRYQSHRDREGSAFDSKPAQQTLFQRIRAARTCAKRFGGWSGGFDAALSECSVSKAASP